MSDTSHRDDRPPERPVAAASAESAAKAAMDYTPSTQPVRDNLGAARAEEHGAPAPSVKPGPKLLVIVAAIAVLAIVAVAFA